MGRWRIEPLTGSHDRNGFDCGNAVLTGWFRRQAGQFEKRDLARTYVLVDPGRPPLVAGYYSLSNCQLHHEELPPAHTKGLPARIAIPAVLLGKLAVAKEHQGQGLGSVLLVNAMKRVLDLSVRVAVRVLVVDAIDGAAAAFYAHQGFTAFPDHPERLFIPVQVVRKLEFPTSDE